MKKFVPYEINEKSEIFETRIQYNNDGSMDIISRDPTKNNGTWYKLFRIDPNEGILLFVGIGSYFPVDEDLKLLVKTLRKY